MKKFRYNDCSSSDSDVQDDDLEVNDHVREDDPRTEGSQRRFREDDDGKMEEIAAWDSIKRWKSLSAVTAAPRAEMLIKKNQMNIRIVKSEREAQSVSGYEIVMHL